MRFVNEGQAHGELTGSGFAVEQGGRAIPHRNAATRDPMALPSTHVPWIPQHAKKPYPVMSGCAQARRHLVTVMRTPLYCVYTYVIMTKDATPVKR